MVIEFQNEVLGGFGVQTDPKIRVMLVFQDTVLRLTHLVMMISCCVALSQSFGRLQSYWHLHTFPFWGHKSLLLWQQWHFYPNLNLLRWILIPRKPYTTNPRECSLSSRQGNLSSDCRAKVFLLAEHLPSTCRAEKLVADWQSLGGRSGSARQTCSATAQRALSGINGVLNF